MVLLGRCNISFGIFMLCLECLYHGTYTSGLGVPSAAYTPILHVRVLSDPQLLFLDEPTSGLDAFAAQQVVNLIKHLADSGTTIVMSILFI